MVLSSFPESVLMKYSCFFSCILLLCSHPLAWAGPKGDVTVRGVAPGGLRTTLQETLERLHHAHGEELNAYEGDSAPFERSRETLASCGPS